MTTPDTSSGIPRFLSGSTLKMFACAIMVIDHAALCLIYNSLLKPFLPVTVGTEMYEVYRFYRFLRGVGRLAFPIFCFFLAEGFLYTKSRAKYALRLLLFGFVSEIPFDLCTKLQPFYWKHQNVMFELLAALLMLSTWEYFDHERAVCLRDSGPVHTGADLKEAGLILCQAGSAAGFMCLAQLLHFDYGFKGLGLILILYLLRRDRLVQCISGAVSISVWELPAVLSFLLLLFYNGKRGRQMRYFFYIFYPAHLLLLYGLSRFISA
ncbi:MAG: conjugal transfer protein TraX [Lachnospiraceae bacterium]|nr:conjugal transfer protein TraX [Lachnospiraceae bacterium]